MFENAEELNSTISLHFGQKEFSVNDMASMLEVDSWFQKTN